MPSTSRPQAWLVLMTRFLKSTWRILKGCSNGSPLTALRSEGVPVPLTRIPLYSAGPAFRRRGHPSLGRFDLARAVLLRQPFGCALAEIAEADVAVAHGLVAHRAHVRHFQPQPQQQIGRASC